VQRVRRYVRVCPLSLLVADAAPARAECVENEDVDEEELSLLPAFADAAVRDAHRAARVRAYAWRSVQVH